MSAPTGSVLRAVPTPIDAAPEDLQPSTTTPRAPLAIVALVVATVAANLLDGLYDPAKWHVAALIVVSGIGVVLATVTPRWSRLAWLVIAGWTLFCGWTALSTTWSLSPHNSWIEADRAVLYLAFVMAAAFAMRTPRARAAAMAAVGGGVAVLFVGTFVVGLLGDPTHLFVLKRLQLPVGYINGVAGLAVIGFWPAIGLAEQMERPVWAGLGAGGATVLASVMILTQSRSVVPAVLVSAVVVLAVLPGRAHRLLAFATVLVGTAAAAHWTLAVFADDRADPFAAPDGSTARAALWAALIAGILVAVIWGLVARALSDRRTLVLGVARMLTVVLVVGGVAGFVAERHRIVHSVNQASSDFRTGRVDEATTVRFASGGGNRRELWRAALDDFNAAPLKGIGAGAYEVRWYEQRHVDEAIRQPHSFPLQVLGELGIVGALFVALAVAGLIGCAWRGVRLARDPKFISSPLALVGAFGSVVAWAVHTSLDWMYNLPAVTGLALVGMAVLMSASSAPFDLPAAGPVAESPSTTGARAGRAATVLRLAALALLATAVASLSVQLAVATYTRQANAAIVSDPARAVARAHDAVRLDSSAVDAWVALAAAEARLGSYARSDAALARVVSAEPESYVGYALRGDLASRAALTKRAAAFYRQAHARNPRDAGLAALAGTTPSS